jgi:hypothetical protein
MIDPHFSCTRTPAFRDRTAAATRRPGWRVAALAAFVVTAIGVVGGDPAGAACLPPQLSVASPTAQPGEAVVVTGVAFGDGCNEHFTGPGPYPDPLGAPLSGIQLQFRQGGSVVSLGLVDAGADYTLSTPVTVPAGATAGPSQVMAVGTGSKTAIPAPLTIVAPSTAVSGPGSGADPGSASGVVGGSGPVADAALPGSQVRPVAARPGFTG